MIKITDQKMPLVKRMIFYSLSALFIIGVSIGTFAIMDSFSSNPTSSDSVEVPDILTHRFLMFLGGCLLLGVAVLIYGMALVTHCCTFDFRKTIWNGLKLKIYLTHTAVVSFLALSTACFVSMILSPILAASGIPWSMAIVIPGLGTVISMQLLFMWVNIWVPLEMSVIKKRMAALGVPAAEIDEGIYVGLSDPAKSSIKKFTLVEEDIGMLWIRSNELYYRGDADSLRIRRDELIEMERKADLGSVSAYGGNVHTVLPQSEMDYAAV